MSLLTCINEGVAYAFLDRILSKFGVQAKVLTYQNTKFHGEFQELCEKTLIDHCTTSWDHFEVDALVEQMVYTVKASKNGLWKYGLQKGHTQD